MRKVLTKLLTLLLITGTMELEDVTFDEAKDKCNDQNKVLFCPKTLEDIETLTNHMGDRMAIWTGIYKNGNDWVCKGQDGSEKQHNPSALWCGGKPHSSDKYSFVDTFSNDCLDSGKNNIGNTVKAFLCFPFDESNNGTFYVIKVHEKWGYTLVRYYTLQFYSLIDTSPTACFQINNS
ncbi:hypothetical protein ACHWQZ_G000692 [Mnemiopsis leidyi]